MDLSLKEIKATLHETLVFLNLVFPDYSDKTTLKYNNLTAFRNAIDRLDKLDLFKELTADLRRTSIYESAGLSVRVGKTEHFVLQNVLRTAKAALDGFYNVLDKTVPDESVNSINIKFPPVHDFDDLASISRDFNTALTQVLYLDEIQGTVTIESVANGSIWLNILVGGSEALAILAGLAWSAAVVYKKVLEGKAVEAHVRSLNIKNESLEDLLKAQRDATGTLIQMEAEQIESEYLNDIHPENVERIKNSIRLLSELIEKGAVIQPALMAPEDVKNLFPNMKNIVGVESRIKKLTS